MIADPNRPLIVTADSAALEELLRVCAAAGVSPLVAADSTALRRSWLTAPLVLIGADLAGAAAALPRRDGVVVIGSERDGLWERAADIGASHVAVLPSAASWLVGLLGEPLPSRSEAAPVLTVAAGSGGGGATTLAVALARTASRAGVRTLLVDADPSGGGIDLALGWESAAGDRWPALTSGVDDGLFERLPERSGLRVLATDRDEPQQIGATAMAALLDRARRSHGLVVVDVPRRVDEPTAAALTAAACTYLVVPAQVRALAAAAQRAAEIRPQARELRLIVRGPAPGGLSAESASRAVGVPLAATVRAEPGLVRGYERGLAPGEPRGPLHRLCLRLLRRHLQAPDDADTDGDGRASRRPGRAA